MIKVRVPATSANIGPGFDCLGIALSLYNTFYFEEINEGLIIEGCEEQYCGDDNLIFISMKKAFDKLDYKYKGIKIKIEDDVPMSRGLGSSASCIIGGIVGANQLTGGKLDNNQILELATAIEGHPDNIAPALLGGLTSAVQGEDKIYYSKMNLSKDLSFHALIPDFKLSTKEARSVLPQDISRSNGVYNIGRTALLLSSLMNNEFNNLKEALNDKLHQPYRGKLIPNFDEIIKKCYDLEGLGVFLSGAGPTIMAISHRENISFSTNIKSFLNELEINWEVKDLSIDYKGTVVLK